ncbi:MAG: 50S ribosomal protein L25 [Candidatus Andersenbacteria bacterium]|nr:50S ribosomal protein L25 [Candidatus Andersenbacteria bacterium]MBI3250509.1 50S ribosomal protein L25 [Candidatus Andersenbacteria bacterium]
MGKQIKLKGTVREKTATAVRRDGLVPAVLYGHKVTSQSIQIDARQFAKVYEQTGYTSLITLELGDGQEHMVILRDIQRHPLRNDVVHADFYQVRMDEKIKANVPLVVTGESSAIKDLGGVLVRPMDEVEVEALPQDLPQNISVDISVLDTFEKIFHVKDLVVPTGVTILAEADEVIALVQEPKTQEELDAELAAEVKEDVEAVEGVKDKPEEGEVAEGAAAPAEGGAPEAKPKSEEKK